MNFQQLEYINAVHRLQHFGKAAEQCNVTQATLSSMIIKLEEELGVIIFDRSKKPVVTTQEGLKIIELAQKGIDLKNELAHFSTNSVGLVSGNLRLGIIPTVASSLLPLLLPTVINEFPELKLIVKEATTDNILELLKKDELDVGILATPTEEEGFEESICYYEPMMLYGVEEKDKQYVSGKDVKNKNIWLLEEGNCFRNQAISVCQIKEKDMQGQPFTFAGSSFDTLLNLTRTFGGYTLVPELYYLQLSKKKKRMCKMFNKPFPVREISLVYQRPYAKSSSIQALQKLLKNTVAPLLSSYQLKPKELNVIGI